MGFTAVTFLFTLPLVQVIVIILALSAAALSAAALSAAAKTSSMQVDGVELLTPKFIGKHNWYVESASSGKVGLITCPDEQKGLPPIVLDNK